MLLSPARGRVRYPYPEAGCTLPLLCLKINELSGGAAALPHFSQLIPNNLLQQRNFSSPRVVKRHEEQGVEGAEDPRPSRRFLPHAARIRIRIWPLPIRNFPLPLVFSTPSVICAKFSLQSLLIVYVRCFIKT